MSRSAHRNFIHSIKVVRDFSLVLEYGRVHIGYLGGPVIKHISKGKPSTHACEKFPYYVEKTKGSDDFTLFCCDRELTDKEEVEKCKRIFMEELALLGLIKYPEYKGYKKNEHY